MQELTSTIKYTVTYWPWMSAIGLTFLITLTSWRTIHEMERLGS